MITTRGPYLSTNHASTGTSQVSVTTKSVKANWIAALPQWYFASIGSTNSVQPYCRFAIIAMQTTPIASCIQRKYGASAAAVGCVVVVMVPPEGTLLFKRRALPVRGFLLCDMPERKPFFWQGAGRHKMSQLPPVRRAAGQIS